MASKIYETKNYDQFNVCDLNRQVEKTSALEESMQKNGWIDAYPMHVVKSVNGQLLIKAGHHRFFVARKLGIPVKYVVCEDDMSIADLEQASRNWSIKDYLYAYSKMENDQYLALKRYHEKTGIGLSTCIGLLSGSLKHGCYNHEKYKKGLFVVTTQKHADHMANIVGICKAAGFGWATHVFFVEAISRIIQLPEIDSNRMISLLKTHAGAIKRQTSVKDYLYALEKLYNKGIGTKVPLAFLGVNFSKKKSKLQ